MNQDNTIITPSINSRSYHVVLLLIVILAMGIRLSAINRIVRLDEARNMQQFAQRTPSEFLFDFSDTNNHFLNTLMLHIQYRLLGNDEDWKIRVHVFVIGILVTIATYYTGKELYDADVGLMASALSSVMFMLVEFSISARGYIIITLIYLVLIILINRMKTQANRRGWLIIGLLSGLGFLVSLAFLYPMGTLVVWAAVSILIENKGQLRRRIFLYFTGSMILGALLTAVYYILALVITFDSWEEFNTSYIMELAQSLDYQYLVSVIIPKTARVVFWYTHMGMSSLIIMMCVFGVFIATIFHYKLSKNRFPIIVATVVSVSVQILVQQSDIFQRVFTFLTPIYAILIAAGLITLVRFVTRDRISQFYIAIFLSLIMCVPITYQLISQEVLPHAGITGYMRNADGIAKMIQETLEPGDYLLSDFTSAKLVGYYLWRNNSDIKVNIHMLLDKEYFTRWKLGGTRYVVDKPNITLLSLVNQWGNLITEDEITFEPVTALTDQIYLYSLTIPPALPSMPTIFDTNEEVEEHWYVGKQNISYDINEDQILTFDMFGDSWKIARYRYGGLWQDYRLATRIKITETSYDFEDLLIRFRENDESYYGLGIKVGDDSNDGFIGLRLEIDGIFLGYFSTAVVDLELNRWYDITVDIEGDTFTVYIGGEQVLQGNDSRLARGTISFLSPPDAKVQITNIRLE
jgi:uncharacterized membrane protein